MMCDTKAQKQTRKYGKLGVLQAYINVKLVLLLSREDS